MNGSTSFMPLISKLVTLENNIHHFWPGLYVGAAWELCWFPHLTRINQSTCGSMSLIARARNILCVAHKGRTTCRGRAYWTATHSSLSIQSEKHSVLRVHSSELSFPLLLTAAGSSASHSCCHELSTHCSRNRNRRLPL